MTAPLNDALTLLIHAATTLGAQPDSVDAMQAVLSARDRVDELVAAREQLAVRAYVGELRAQLEARERAHGANAEFLTSRDPPAR